MENKIYTQDEIKQMLITNDRAVERAIVAIWNKQTSIEKSNQVTQEHNGVGYSAFDAGFMSSLAERLTWHQRGLTAKQISAARKVIVKYSHQLTLIANKEI